jgi:TRAP-type C4-dicarboxylate transport system permease large subunit
MPLEAIFRGIMPFLLAVFVGIVILAVFPQIVMVLPNLIY